MSMNALMLGHDDLGDDDDDYGDDDLGDDDFLGGPKPKKKTKKSKFAALQPGHQVQPLPFPNTSVAAGATTTVTQRAQRPFQIQRATWASTSAPFFTINQLLAGMENMFAAPGSVPAEVFSSSAFGTGLRGYIVYPGIDMTLQVTNNDGSAHTIEFTIIGAALI
ncbi:MAG TPA: hypothetical protein VFZ53_23765 [Polyangiaceae bacterium]